MNEPANLWGLLEQAASGGTRTAIRDATETWSYGQLRAHAAGLAARLRSEGVRRCDRIAVLEDNTRGFVTAYFGAAGGDAILLPLNLRLAVPELRSILADAEAKLVLAGQRHLGPAGELGLPVLRLDEVGPAEVRVDPARGGRDPAQLYYTSGTTGRPKGVVLTHRNVATHATWAIAELGLGATDVWGHFAPLFHLADAWAVFAITAVQATHVMLPRFDAAACLDTIARERVTITNLVPTMLASIEQQPRGHDLGSMRLVLSGGAPISADLVRRLLERFGCEYAQTYGMTETSPYLTVSLLDDELRGLPPEDQLRWRAKTGRPFGHVELRVVGEAGREVAPDERQVGEIQVRGPTVTPGYWRNDAETAAAFDGDWLRTGDLAVRDTKGFVTIVDRKKDMIVSGGENVYSIEVENALYAHEAVVEAAVWGEPDAAWGETVHAAVVLTHGSVVTSDELRESCRRRLAGFKVPRRIMIRETLPRTGSGKIDKKQLRGRSGPERS